MTSAVTPPPNGAAPPTLGPDLRLKVTFTSDWHVGSGTGRPGDVDRLVRRDADGLPWVPAKTLTGIWRDACEQVAFGLDDGNTAGGWHRLVSWLFGTEPARGDRRPVPAALSVRPARLAEALRAALVAHPRVAQELTFVKPGVRIDPASGRAMDDHLRFEEQVRLGAVLWAEARLGRSGQPLDPGLVEVAEALLVAGALLVERLGGNRRRGAGRCTLQIVGAEDPQQWLDRLAGAEAPSVPDPDEAPAPAPTGSAGTAGGAEPSGATASSEASTAGGWVTFPVSIEALTPILVPDRVRGNVALSLDVVPGTALLGALGRSLATRGIDLAPHLRAGELVVTDLVPSPDGSPSFPVPLVFARAKTGDGRLYNRLCQTPPDGVQLKVLRSGVVAIGATGSEPTISAPQRSAATHATIDDARQRPTSDVGGVFTYEALPAGTRFTGAIRMRGSLAARIEKAGGPSALLPKRVELGRSKKDDYGLGEVTIGEVTSVDQHAEHTYGQGDRLTVWLCSDALLVDERHRPDPTLDRLETTLEAALGRGLRRAPVAPDGMISAAVETSRRESWHAGWRLPRPGLIGMRAGSVAVFELEGPVDGNRLDELEAAGIGLRTAEGFGQVRFNDPLLASASTAASSRGAITDHTAAPPASDTITDPGDRAFVDVLERAAWKAAIVRAATTLAADPQRRTEALGWDAARQAPPASQLGGLRQLLGGFEAPRGIERAQAWVEHLRGVKNRASKWPNEALDELERLLSDQDTVWELLEPHLPDDELCLTPSTASDRRKELRPFALRVLLSTAVRAHLRAAEQGRQD
ncbi:RAMP superfamily CRISPR-associated protein [Rhabdothermincola sediminis]|uniref:RAMP superfamily CRISPR-associated protein n=1 Tax=Rhabdothermincola sediminis TaxID=2751370 RepID=UPI001AA095B5|nr:RAMP superfamily CRISPR-associated protein [Rhabdothermincola sediminis]